MKKTFAVIISIIILCCLFTACSGSDNNSAEKQQNQVAGIVTDINGCDVTLDTINVASSEPGGMKGADGPFAENGGNMQKPESGNMGEPPQKPDNMPSSSDTPPENGPENRQSPPSGQEGERPDMPENMPGDKPEDMPDGNDKSNPGNVLMATSYTKTGETVTVTLDEEDVNDLSVDDIIMIDYDNQGKVANVRKVMVMTDKPGENSDGPDANNVDTGSAAFDITEDSEFKGSVFSSENADENAVRISGAKAGLTEITLNKTDGDATDTDSGNFYGLNAGLLATDGASVNISDSEINTSAETSNAVFSYGQNTSVKISDTVIRTTGGNSGGIMTTGGAETNAQNLDIETAGRNSAAIRLDKGGGTVTVKNGTYRTKGSDSPAVYSTGSVSVSDAELCADNSEALVIEGGNSISIDNTKVTGKMGKDGASASENIHNIMIYQSMSGDAETGNAYFEAKNSEIISEAGDMFYITNTSCDILLSNNTFINNDTDAYFMRICGNSGERGWGQSGSNGAATKLTLSSQLLEGNIYVDSISSLEMILSEDSEFTGCLMSDSNTGNISVTIDEGCTWNLTGDCSVKDIVNNGNINFNGFTITLADGSVLK